MKKILTIAITLILASACAFAGDAPAKVIRKGGVTFFPQEKRIEIQGKFMMKDGPIELLACAAGGKDYESIISLDVNPEILHFTLILMGLKPGGDSGPKFQGDPEHAPSGSPVAIRVKWQDKDGSEKIVPAEKLCWSPIDRRTMESTPWVFAGSKKLKDPETGKEVYWANVEKSIITVFRDPFSVLDLPLASSASDESYVVNSAIVPEPGTPCTIMIEPGPALQPTTNRDGGNIWHVDITLGGRVLVGGGEPANINDAFAIIRTKFPKDSFRVTMDHGAPAAAAATAFDALAVAGGVIESIKTVRLNEQIQSDIVIASTGGKTAVNGAELSSGQLKETVLAAARKLESDGPAGVCVKIDRANLKSAASIIKQLQGIDDQIILSIIPIEN